MTTERITDEDIDLERCEQVALAAARDAGKLVRETWRQGLSVETKLSYADLVTSTDKNAEKMIFDRLRYHFPSYKLIGEETSCSASSKLELTNEPTWIVDPVDGTMNFVHGNMFVGVSIGLTLNKKPVLGVVYAPLLDKMYKARVGKGATCNDEPIKVSKVSELNQSLVAIEMGSARDEEKFRNTFDNLQSVGWRAHGIRSTGAASLDACFVADGQFDAFYEFGLWPWDMCASAIIIEEAGGYVCDTTGNLFELTKRRWVVASSEKLAKQVASKLVHQMELSC